MVAIPKGSKLRDLYGPTQFTLKIRRFKRPFMIHFAKRNETTGRMEYAHASMGGPQDLIDFQVKLTAGKVEMIDGLSLTVQLFGAVAEQCGMLEDSGAEMEFMLPEGPVPTDAPKACQSRRWESVSKGVPQGVTCGKTTGNVKCEREGCPDPNVKNDDRYWGAPNAG